MECGLVWFEGEKIEPGGEQTKREYMDDGGGGSN